MKHTKSLLWGIQDEIYKKNLLKNCSSVPANAVELEDATDSPGINVLSSMSRPNKSRSSPEPQTPLSKVDISSRTALK